jgi:hypothetical protein
MASSSTKITAYIGSVINPQIDSKLEQIGFCRGLIVFAIPEYGILFRCRADGEPINLEFGALFSLLRFLETSLASLNAKEVLICSSSAELVASFGNTGRHLSKGSEREIMLREYTRKLRISVQYVDRLKNRCFLSPVDYPSMPGGQEPPIKPDWKELRKNEIKPIQKGIKL